MIYSLLYCIIAKLAIGSEFLSVCYTPELPVRYLNVGNEGNLLSLRQWPVFPSNLAYNKGPTLWPWRGGISRWFEKKLSCSAAWFRGEKISCKGIPVEKKNPTLKKKLSWRVKLEKKSYTVICRVKKLYQTKWPIPPSPLPTTPHSKVNFTITERILARWLPVIGRELCPMVQRKMPRRLLKVSGF